MKTRMRQHLLPRSCPVSSGAEATGAKRHPAPSLLRKLPLDIGIHRLGERALHTDRGTMLVERIALEHAKAAPAHADRRRVQKLIDGALGERDGLRVAPCDQKAQEALALGQTWHGISASRLLRFRLRSPDRLGVRAEQRQQKRDFFLRTDL